MSERDGLAAWVAPFRQAQTLLGEVTDAARTLADDSVFEDVFTRLSSLPSAADFNPLQAAQSLPVDIAPVQAAVEQVASIPRQFVDALQQRARTSSSTDARASSRSAVGTPSQTASRASTRGSSFSAQAFDALQQQASALLSGEKSLPAPNQVLHQVMNVTRGSWSALERIAELVQGLEPATGGPGEKAATSTPAPANTPAAAATARGQRGESTARLQETASRVLGQQGEQAVTGLQLLQGLVDAAWGAVTGGQGVTTRPEQTSAGKGASAERNAQAASSNQTASPAPSAQARGSSMLNPQLATRPGNGSSASSTASAAGSPVSENSTGERSTPPAIGVTDDDELAERLNRALIEQAWRGGVDLT